MSSQLETAASDPWAQLFFVLALMSGALALSDGWQPGRALPKAQPAAANMQISPIVVPVKTEQAVEAKPAPEHKGASWIVDKSMGAGADGPSLGPILDKAKDGDVVTVRPGVYAESLVISKSVSIVGAGDKRDVRVTSDGPVTAAVTAGKASFKNVTVANGGSPSATAVSAGRDADVALQDVSVWSAGQGLRVSGGRLASSGVEVSARIAVLVEGGGRVSLEGGSVSGLNVGVLMKGDMMDAQIKKTAFRNCERAIDVEGKSAVTVTDSEFSLKGQGGAVFAFSGADAAVANSRIELNHIAQVGVFAENASVNLSGVAIRGSKGAGIVGRRGATIILDKTELSDNEWAGLVVSDGSRARSDDSRFAGNADCGIDVNDATVVLGGAKARKNRCGIAFHGPGKVASQNGVFEDNALGSVLVKPGFESQVAVTGSGNTGLQTTDQPRTAASAAAPAPPPPPAETKKYFAAPHLGRNPFRQDPGTWKDKFSQNQR